MADEARKDEGTEELTPDQEREKAFQAAVNEDDETPEVEKEEPSGETGQGEEKHGKDEEQAEGKTGEDKGSEDKGSESDEKEAQQEQDDLPAWIEALPEDQREAVAKEFTDLRQQLAQRDTELEQSKTRYTALHGQLLPTQRKLTYLERTNKLLSSAMSATGDDFKKKRAQLEERIEKLGEDFPEDAKELKEILSAYANQLEPQAENYRSTLSERNDDVEVDVNQQQSLLQRLEPSVGQISVDPRFQDWLKTHPEAQEKVKSPYAHDVVEVTDQFKADVGWQEPLTAEDFVTTEQIALSPMFHQWAQEIGITPHAMQGMTEFQKNKVFNDFRRDLDAAVQSFNGTDEEADHNEGDAEAIRLEKRRKQQRSNKSPAPGKSGAPTSGKSGPPSREDVFRSAINETD